VSVEPLGSVQQAAKPPAYQLLAADLRLRITSGQLRPGDRLPTEPELCARSGVSRSTVREALRLLASQHLVITTRGVSGGSFVAHPSADQLADTFSMGARLLLSTARVEAGELFEMREWLEIPAVELAARRRTAGHLTELEAALYLPADGWDAVDPGDAMAAARQFHIALAAATGNSLLELVARPLYNLANDRELGAAPPAGFWARVDAEHREILCRVVARDAAGAAAVTRTHLAHLKATYVEGDRPLVPDPRVGR
jgi:GntR family transcriptional repressor for pyruvate dehydrogenase complex